MPGIVEFPTIVQQAVERFGPIFINQPERRHFAEYLTGLMVAEKKNVTGINSEFAVTTDQSCLNRWINDVDWDVQSLNEKRLESLQKDPSTRYSKRGVIAIDNTPIGHYGKLIEDAGYFWDHADKRYLIAHDYLIANYVTTLGKHYALEFRRFRKREHCEAKRKELDERKGGFDAAPEEEKKPCEFKTHTVLFQELVDWVVEHDIPGDFAFDSHFTNAPVMNHVNAYGRAYVGDLKFNRKIRVDGREIRADEFAESIPPEDRKPVKAGGRRQWYFTKTIRFPEVDHPVRIPILWDRKNAKKAAKIVATNRTRWEVVRMLGVYRKRPLGHACLRLARGRQGDLSPGRQATSFWLRGWATVRSGRARALLPVTTGTCTSWSWRRVSSCPR